ncbi:MAG TPA: fasciclin domain-containing protein [Chryseolinea sp.]|nr:fasciclin domain-containing protein [Chryseolinea sp.]
MNKIIAIGMLVAFVSCGQQQSAVQQTVAAPEEVGAGQSAVNDSDSAPNVVQVAVGSAEHSTLVVAVKAGELVDALSNAGPFTVFAPTNAAFDKLPDGTVDDLLKPENKEKLQDILQYHVYVGVISETMVQDGMKLNQVNGGDVVLNKKDGKMTINGANILGSVKASNGIVYVIDAVLLPPAPATK